MKLAAALLLVACHRHPALTSCDDKLDGVWHTDGGDWMILDYGPSLEGYPLFPDARSPAPTDLSLAPRSLDLHREGPDKPGGFVDRRYTRGADHCLAKAPFHVTACSDHTLEVVVAEPRPPLAFAPCRAADPAPSHRERWVRD